MPKLRLAPSPGPTAGRRKRCENRSASSTVRGLRRGKQIGPGGGQKVHGPCSSAHLGAAESPRELICKRKSLGEVGELGTALPIRPRGIAPLIPILVGFLGPQVSSLVGPVQIPTPRPKTSQGTAISPSFSAGESSGFRGHSVSQPGRAGRAAPDPRSQAGCERSAHIYFWCREVSSPAGR